MSESENQPLPIVSHWVHVTSYPNLTPIRIEEHVKGNYCEDDDADAKLLKDAGAPMGTWFYGNFYTGKPIAVTQYPDKETTWVVPGLKFPVWGLLNHIESGYTIPEVEKSENLDNPESPAEPADDDSEDEVALPQSDWQLFWVHDRTIRGIRYVKYAIAHKDDDCWQWFCDNLDKVEGNQNDNVCFKLEAESTLETTLKCNAAAGNKTIDVASSEDLTVGCRVLIGEGKVSEEVIVVAFGSLLSKSHANERIGSLVLQSPLKNNWGGTTITAKARTTVQTTLKSNAYEGDKTLDVVSMEGFTVGCPVTIDDGKTSEQNVVEGCNQTVVKLKTPLKNSWYSTKVTAKINKTWKAMDQQNKIIISIFLPNDNDEYQKIPFSLCEMYLIKKTVPKRIKNPGEIKRDSPPEALPNSINVSGVAGTYSCTNGVYNLSTTKHNGMPLWQGVADQELWLLYAINNKWCVTNTEAKDENTEACFIQATDAGPALPTLVPSWAVGDEFRVQDSVQVVEIEANIIEFTDENGDTITFSVDGGCLIRHVNGQPLAGNHDTSGIVTNIRYKPGRPHDVRDQYGSGSADFPDDIVAKLKVIADSVAVPNNLPSDFLMQACG